MDLHLVAFRSYVSDVCLCCVQLAIMVSDVFIDCRDGLGVYLYVFGVVVDLRD